MLGQNLLVLIKKKRVEGNLTQMTAPEMGHFNCMDDLSQASYDILCCIVTRATCLPIEYYNCVLKNILFEILI